MAHSASCPSTSPTTTLARVPWASASGARAGAQRTCCALPNNLNTTAPPECSQCVTSATKTFPALFRTALASHNGVNSRARLPRASTTRPRLEPFVSPHPASSAGANSALALHPPTPTHTTGRASRPVASLPSLGPTCVCPTTRSTIVARPT